VRAGEGEGGRVRVREGGRTRIKKRGDAAPFGCASIATSLLRGMEYGENV